MTSNHEEILFYFDILFSRLWVFLSAHNPINHEFCFFFGKDDKMQTVRYQAKLFPAFQII